MRQYAVLIVIALFLPFAVHAESATLPVDTDTTGVGVPFVDVVPDSVELKTPQPRIGIPGLQFTPINQNADEGVLYVSSLGEYIAAVYRYAVAIASLVAAVMIIVAGFQWTASGGSADAITSAKKRIVGAVTGLVLALGSYTILYAVNPELVQFRSLRVQFVKPIPLESTEGFPEPTTGSYSTIERAACDNEKLKTELASYATQQEKLGKRTGFCLGWVNAAFSKICGGVPAATKKLGAWDVAATFKDKIMQNPCSLNGIKDGDLVFMTSLGSDYIGLWENFRVENGCTLADAKRNTTILIKGKNQQPVAGAPTGMPPVTHIGIFSDGKIYHLTSKVNADSRTLVTRKTAPAVQKSNWQNVPPLQGNFIGPYFIAGYASW